MAKRGTGWDDQREESRQDGSWRSSRPSSTTPREFWGRKPSSAFFEVVGGSDSSDRSRRPSGNYVATASSRSSEASSWRRPSTFVETNTTSVATDHRGETSSRGPAGPAQKRSQASPMQRGKILTLKLNEGFCFIEGKSNNIYCRLDKAETGMLEVEVGDIMEYISNDSPDNPRALYARLVHCNQRSLEALVYYLTVLSDHEDFPGRFLREITKCPVGFLQVLNIPKPTFYHVRAVLKLANSLSDHNHALSYTARLKQFYGLFRGTVFLKSSGALREFCMEMLETRTEEMWLKMFVKRLVEHSPGSVSEVLALVNAMVETTSEEKIRSNCRFLLDLLSTQAGIALGSSGAWDEMQLLPTDMELRDFSTPDEGSSSLSRLPYVKKKGSYGSVEEYLDTYLRLLKEDCFWGVKRGISNLRRGILDPRDMRVWMEGHVMGIHFDRIYSGISIAIQVKSLGHGRRRNRFPMAGSLVCLSDDGGNFESPIWAIVARCEEAGKEDFTMFVEIEDGLSHGRAEEGEVQSIGRLFGASNVVVAESPTFYKAYQPVLKSLQQKDLHNFPFIEELVHARCPSEPPHYLTSSTTVDWRCLFEERDQKLSIGDRTSCFTDEVQYATMRSNIKELDNLVTYSGCRTTLDESQLEAVKLALNNRLALIQGPPGTAMYEDVLKMLCPTIVFVEEAAEILEPQVLALLGPSVQHLILIGDHYQLYPRVQCHELENGHDFGVSMFERLVEHNDLPFRTLSVQSRMRDEFLPMITPIYHNVRSNITLVSGKRNKAPDCMMSPMHFWSHSFEESRDHRSFRNEGEAQMVIALLCWMISEGENHAEISVLAAYSGQVALLRDKLRASVGLEGIPVYTIDRFQGSENRIIIVSLVRSNEKGDIGYLAKRNRLCVAVSRARGAVYFCGNDTTLAKRSEHWHTLADCLRDQGCLSDQIHVCCPRHALDPPLTVGSDNADAFNPLMCQRPCRAKLRCDHYCQSTCHRGDHPVCTEEVQFVFKRCGHEATKECTEDEETKRCEKEISFTFQHCGHTDVFQCWETSTKGFKCLRLCSKKLEPCGHPCALECFKDCKTSPCAVCVEIEKDKSRKQRLQEAKELELKKKELETEINRLKLQDDPELVSVEDIDPDGERAAEYLQVKDLTEKFIQPTHGIFPAVIRIEKVSNLRLQIKFLECQKDLLSPTSPTRLLFHGTDDAGIQGIIREGFRIPTANKDNMFGQGCYFATDSSKSAQQIYTKGSNKLLLCEVLLGRTWTVQEAHPQMDSEIIKKKGFDSLFSKREGKRTRGTLYDEFVIYNPRQAISRYIVHYKNLSFDPGAIPSSHDIPTQQNLIRIPYKMSNSFSGDSLAEYHFRFAESQFFRMAKKVDSKVVKVEYILNKMLLRKYEAAKDEFAKEKKFFEEMLVFHGTDKDAIEKIIDEGFKIGGQGVELRNGKLYGSGVYTALDPDTSINYSKGGMILLSSALVGKEGVDYNKGSSPDVLVLRKTDHLLPKYIVHFTNR